MTESVCVCSVPLLLTGHFDKQNKVRLHTANKSSQMSGEDQGGKKN